MLKARKANRVVAIPDEKRSVYEKLGYTILTMDGRVVHKHVEPKKEADQLKVKVADLEAKLAEAHTYAENADKKIEELTAENTGLKTQVADLVRKLAEAEKKTASGAANNASDAGKQAAPGKQVEK